MTVEKQKQFQRRFKHIRRDQEENRAERLAEELNLPYLNLDVTKPRQQDASFIPEEKAKDANLVTIRKDGKKIHLAVENPHNEKTKKVIGELEKEGYKCKIFIVSKSSLETGWKAYEFKAKHAQESLKGALIIPLSEMKEAQESLRTVDDLQQQIEQMPTSELLKIVFAGAIKMKASDIHLEPGKENIRLRYRIDGILQKVATFPSKQYRFLLSRIKTHASMLLNVHDKSQDGSFAIHLVENGKTQKSIDLRISVLPSNFGETTTIRLLSMSISKLKLEELGVRPSFLKILKEEINRPNGMVLNTGPTGSGKTTTLYACLNHINEPTIKIITIENPIEYKLAGITQTQINPKKGYTFASSLRGVVRQDPDVLMLGEIRDEVTAQTALDFALTGHIVLSTLHTNQAAGAIPRLIEMDTNPASLASGTNLIIAQRLVRKLCPDCKKTYQPSLETKQSIKTITQNTPKQEGITIPKTIDKLYKPEGCSKCHGLGYKGRIGVFEFLQVNSEIKEMIKQKAVAFEIQKKAQKLGMITFEQDAILRTIEGLTSVEETERVIGPLDTIANNQ